MLIEVGNGDISAFARVGDGHSAAYAAVGTGDQRNLAGKPVMPCVGLFAAVRIRIHPALRAGHRLRL